MINYYFIYLITKCAHYVHLSSADPFTGALWTGPTFHIADTDQ